MEPLGITRACTSVPSIKRNARITQNHEITSCQMRSPAVSSFGFSSRTSSGNTASVSTSAFTMSLHFELHQFSRVAARVARRAEFSFGIFPRRAHGFEREITERIRAKELAYLFDGIVRSDQFLAPRRVHAIVTRRNCGRTADAHVHLGGACFAHQAHDLSAGGAAHNGIIHENHAFTLKHSKDRIEVQFS